MSKIQLKQGEKTEKRNLISIKGRIEDVLNESVELHPRLGVDDLLPE